jgi:hypothetical protein
MANIRYFADHNGQAVQLANVGHDGSIYSSAKHFKGYTAEGALLVCSRAIEYKRNPSQHQCGPRCLNAVGHLCECECGGKNHGRGA